ncbi:MAG: saccharopine dehydrogenase NADP-binding domain-containing protein [Steroidobacteraceae bacterium]|nr:saccharopine dehydrogenase NADP-binding domain-containing protein [Steroidobacteraceae bacterium]
MSNYPVHVTFPGRLVMIGFGSIGQGVLPLIFRHLEIKPDQVTIVTKDDLGEKVAAEYGVRFIRQSLTRENFKKVLDPLVGRGDFLLNLSVDVSSVALIQFCWEQGSLYLDTCIEPWVGGYMDLTAPPARRTNYALRETALALRNAKVKAPTAVITHGANPGLVSHFVKQALLNIASDTGLEHEEPASREAWAQLAQQLGVKVIHIAERDTQVSLRPKEQGEFVNTWSVDGFAGEGCQPAELGWGSHEKNWPRDGKKHDFGRGSAIYLMQPGAATRVRTWTPLAQQFHGFLITHGESISISDYLSVKKGEKVEYRPTVHYAYHPCDDAVLSVHEFAGRNWQLQERKRIMMDEIVKGVDELGVLLAGHKKNAYWYGSQLSVQEARDLCPHNNATSLQVTVSVLAGLIWAMENPNEGVVEPEDLDFRRILEICRPYLGPVVGEYTEWHPLVDRARLFPEDLDQTDPWQFKNVRVV